MALAPPQSCPQPPPCLCPQPWCRDLLQSVTLQIVPPLQHLPPAGFVQIITVPWFPQCPPPWSTAGSMDKFSDQFSPWSRTDRRAAGNAGLHPWMLSSLPSPSSPASGTKIIKPSFHPFTPWLQLEELPAHQTPPDQGISPKIFPLILPEVLGSEVSTARCPPVVFATKKSLGPKTALGRFW